MTTMASTGVTVDRSRSPSAIAFEAGFNAAVPFVDRHLPEGRGAKAAIRTAAGEVTYAELAANVNRCGNALLRQGLARGQRLLLVVKDCPEFFYLFWGAIKAGVIPVPLNTIRAGTRQPAALGKQPRGHTRPGRRVWQ
jgi:acyl-coenzyme A synthetase/AMP-(fatty) acid ligase